MGSHRKNPSSAGSENVRQWLSNELVPHGTDLRRYLKTKFRGVDADDVTQEAFYRLITAPNSSTIKDARAFLFATARNIALDLIRREKAAPFSDVSADHAKAVSFDAPAASEAASRRQERSLLEAAILKLPARCRATLELHLFEDLSPPEIARRLGISGRAVNTHLRTGIERCTAFVRARGLARSERGKPAPRTRE